MDSALLAQTTNAGDGLVFVARLNCDALNDVIVVANLNAEPAYKTHPVYSQASSGLYLTFLPGDILVTGQVSQVHAIIDVYEGDAANASSAAAIGSYLANLSGGSDFTFVYALPGMYQFIPVEAMSLDSAKAISGWLSFSNGSFFGEATLYTPNADSFAGKYNPATSDYEKPVTLFPPAINGQEPRIVVSIPMSPINKSQTALRNSRHEVKRLFHIMNANEDTSKIATSGADPWKNFFVDDYPPSIFINYEIPEDQLAAFSAAVVPNGYQMEKISILEGEPEAYYLVLNIYTALGLAPGVRYEWSVFLEDQLIPGKPRFMVIEALAAGLTIDPVNGWTGFEPVSYETQWQSVTSHRQQARGWNTLFCEYRLAKQCRLHHHERQGIPDGKRLYSLGLRCR